MNQWELNTVLLLLVFTKQRSIASFRIYVKDEEKAKIWKT